MKTKDNSVLENLFGNRTFLLISSTIILSIIASFFIALFNLPQIFIFISIIIIFLICSIVYFYFMYKQYKEDKVKYKEWYERKNEREYVPDLVGDFHGKVSNWNNYGKTNYSWKMNSNSNDDEVIKEYRTHKEKFKESTSLFGKLYYKLFLSGGAGMVLLRFFIILSIPGIIIVCERMINTVGR